MFQVQTIMLVSSLFVCLQSSSILWFSKTVTNVVHRKSKTWFLSFQKKNMMGCAFVAEAWNTYDVHCLINSLRANVWECVQVVGKLEIHCKQYNNHAWSFMNHYHFHHNETFLSCSFHWYLFWWKIFIHISNGE